MARPVREIRGPFGVLRVFEEGISINDHYIPLYRDPDDGLTVQHLRDALEALCERIKDETKGDISLKYRIFLKSMEVEDV